MLTTLESGPQTTRMPSARHGKRRFGVVIILVLMLLLAYLTIAVLRSTLQSPTHKDSASGNLESVDQ